MALSCRAACVLRSKTTAAGEVWHGAAGCSCQENPAGVWWCAAPSETCFRQTTKLQQHQESPCPISALDSTRLCPCGRSRPVGHPRGCFAQAKAFCGGFQCRARGGFWLPATLASEEGKEIGVVSLARSKSRNTCCSHGRLCWWSPAIKTTRGSSAALAPAAAATLQRDGSGLRPAAEKEAVRGNGNPLPRRSVQES